MAFNPEGKNLAEIYPALTQVQSWLSMMACLDPVSDSTLITKVQTEKIQPHLDTLYEWFMGPKPVVEPFDLGRVKVTELGETEELDGDGTYATYYLVEHEDYTASLDYKGLEKYANDEYQYSGGPGQYFCSRVTVWKHPYSGDKAIVQATHQMDI